MADDWDLLDPDTDSEIESLVNGLRASREKHRSLVSSLEDLDGTEEALTGDWTDWMCTRCGVFMKEHRTTCTRCRTPRY